MHSKTKGNIAEACVILALSSIGCNVFKELGDLSKIDLVAEYNGKLISIQCKGVTPVNGCIMLHMKKSGPNYSFTYTKDQFDFFAVCNLESMDVALVSSSVLDNHVSRVNLRINSPKNNQTEGIVWFKDFTDLKRILDEYTSVCSPMTIK